MATEGRTDYEINVSGDFEKQLDSFVTKVAGLDKALAAMKGTLATASKVTSTKNSNAAEKASATLKETLDTQKSLTASKQEESDILGDIEASEGARKKIIASVKNAQTATEIAMRKQLATIEATAQANSQWAKQVVKIQKAQILVDAALKAGLSSTKDIADATGLTEKKVSELLNIEKAKTATLTVQELAQKRITDATKQQLVASEAVRLAQESGLTSVKDIAQSTKLTEKYVRDTLDSERQMAAQRQLSLDKQRQQTEEARRLAQITANVKDINARAAASQNRVNVVTGEISTKVNAANAAYVRQQQATERINASQRNSREIVDRLASSNNKVNAITGQISKKVADVSNETEDAHSNTNKLLLSFKQVLFTVVKFKIARGIFDFITDSVNEMSRFNAEIEISEKSIASLIASVGKVRDVSGNLASGIDAFQKSLTLSKNIVNQLRIDATRTEATFEGLVSAFQVAVAPGLAAGLNLDQIRTTTINITRAATQLGVPVRQLSEEIRSVLNGTIRLNNTRLAPLFNNEDIRNAKEQGTLFTLLSEKLSVYEESAGEVANTFNVLASNVKDSSSVILASGSVQYFESLKQILRDVNDTINKGSSGSDIVNPDAVKVVQNLSEGLAVFVNQIGDVIKSEEAMAALDSVTASVGRAFKLIGAVAEPILRGILIAVDVLVSPFEILLFLVDGLYSVFKGKMGQTIQTIGAYFVAWLISVKAVQLSILSINKVALAYKGIMAGIGTLNERWHASMVATSASASTTNSTLTATSGILSGISIKMAMITGVLSLAFGLIASYILNAASSTETSASAMSDLSGEAGKLARSIYGIRDAMNDLPPSVSTSNQELQKMSKYLEDNAKKATELSAQLAVKKALLGTNEAIRDIVSIQATSAEGLKETLKQSKNQTAEAEKQISLLRKELKGREAGIEAVAKSNDLLAKRRSELEKQKALGEDVSASLEEVGKKELANAQQLRRVVLSQSDSKVTSAQKSLKLAEDELSTIQRQREEAKYSAALRNVGSAPGQRPEGQERIVELAEKEQAAKERVRLAEKAIDSEIVARVGDVTRLNGLLADNADRAELDKTVTEASLKQQQKLVDIKAAEVLLSKQKEENSTRALELDRELQQLVRDNAETQSDKDNAEAKLLEIRIKLRDREFTLQKDILKAEIQILNYLASNVEDTRIQNDLLDMQATKEAELLELNRKRNQIIFEMSLTQTANTESQNKAALSALAIEKTKLDSQQNIIDREAAISRAKIENSNLIASNQIKEIALIEAQIVSQGKSLGVLHEKLNLQIQTLEAEKLAEKDLNTQAELQEEINSAVAERSLLLQQEQSNTDALQQKARELRALASNDIGAGIDIGLQKFVEGSTGMATTFSSLIVSGLDGAAATSGKLFSDALDPRKNADIENAFADLFYGLAGQLAQEVTKQLLASAVTVALEQSSTGILADGLSYLATVLGLQTASTQAQTIATTANTTAVGAAAATDTGTEVVKGGISAATSAASEGGATTALVPLVTSLLAVVSFVAAELAILTASSVASLVLLSGILVLQGIVAGIAAAQLAESIIQTAWIIFTALWTALDASIPFSKGGQVKGYATGGEIKGARTSIPRPAHIPRSDTVPAWLTPNEFVMRVDAVKKYGTGFMSALNEGIIDPSMLLGMPVASVATGAGAGIKAFADGGKVTGGSGNVVSTSGRNSNSPMIVPILPVDNATADVIFRGGRKAFENGVNRTNIKGDPNSPEQWN